MPDLVEIEVAIERWAVEVVLGGQTTIVSSGVDLQPRVVAFNTPTKPWIVNHNLNYIPQTWVTDLAGNLISIEKTVTLDRVTVEPNQPMVGYLYYR